MNKFNLKKRNVRRKAYLIEHLEKIVMVLSNKARFIKEQCDDTIDLRKKKKQQVVELLKSRNYDVIDGDNDYKYLRSMTIDSVEEENVVKLEAEKMKRKKELDIIKKKTIEMMWTEELNKLEKEYEKFQQVRKSKLFGEPTKKKKIKKNVSKNKSKA